MSSITAVQQPGLSSAPQPTSPIFSETPPVEDYEFGTPEQAEQFRRNSIEISSIPPAEQPKQKSIC
jgi:hypothetical protein